MTETVENTATGAILYDKAIINQISEERFMPGGWPHAEALTGPLRSGGRGNTMYVGNVPRQFVLRHYLRGGLIGKLIRDRYVFSGADKTRPFMEWRLLDKLTSNNLRVPRPAAARYCRSGTFYTGDIITVRIPGVIPLSQYIADNNPDGAFWHSIGESIYEFHEAGVYHADMNAYNLQIDDSGLLWMLDFDKGSLRPRGPWQQATLSRLHRSLYKVVGLDPRLNFRAENWEQLLQGYFSASRSA
ncbi:MAG: 3-deoxy-D-manno-octulosonic acid kinase [Gammaproteobacteria bacterium]|nr:3-deoxy-D-manno-octulosonic acid kinase [Gammaproteobacteria bacterium]MDH3480592.1 3-deoxy-D-manno-octulosonic acid kinase [Gammaproteobacteria bacterium]